MRANRYVSYLGAEIEPKAITNLNAFEAATAKTFARVESFSARGQAKMGLGGMDDRARRQIALTEAQLARTRAQIERTGAASRRTGQDANYMASGFNRAAQALGVVQGPLGPLAGRLGALGAVFRQLSGFTLTGVLAGGGAFALGSIATQYQQVTDRLRPLYEGQQELNTALKDVVGIAQRTRQALDPVAQLYSRMTLASRDSGMDPSRIAGLTETASKAARLSGGDAQSQHAGLTQFAQGFGSGSLSGDELKSIKENTLRLATAIAQGLDLPMSKLKELGAAGALTPQIIAAALERSADIVDLEFSRLPKRIGTSLTELGNSVSIFIGRADEAVGATAFLANALSALAQNLDTTVGVAAIALAAYNAKTIVAGFGAAVTATTGFVAAQKRAFQAELEYNMAVQQGTAVALGSATAQREKAAYTLAASEAEVAAAQRALAAGELAQAQTREQLALLAQQRAAQIAVRDAAAAVAGGADPVVARSQQRVAALQRELAAAVETRAAHESQVRAFQRADALLRANTSLPAGQQAALIAKNAAAMEVAEKKLAASRVIAEARARALAVAEIELATVMQSQGVVAAEALAKANNDVNTTTMARIRTEQMLAGIDMELAAAEVRLAEATYAAAAAQLDQNAALAVAVPAAGRASVAMTVLTTALNRLSATTVSVVNFLGGPWGVAFVAATGAMMYLMSQTNHAKAAIDNFKGGQEALAERLGITTAKLREQGDAARQLALELAELGVAKAREQQQAIGPEIGSALMVAQQDIGIRSYVTLNRQKLRDANRLRDIARQANRGQFSLDQIKEIREIRERNPASFKGSFVDRWLGQDPGQLTEKVQGFAAATLTLADAEKHLGEVRKRLAEPRKPPPVIPQPRTASQLAAAAQQEAARSDLERARADLAAMKGAGKKDNETEAEYITRLSAAIQRVRDLTQAEKDRRSAGAAGRRADAAARREESAAERARDKASSLAGVMDRYTDDTLNKRLEKIRDEAEKAKRAIDDLVGERVAGFDGAFTEGDAAKRKAQIDAYVAKQAARETETSISSVMDRFIDDTPIRRLEKLRDEAKKAKEAIDALVDNPTDGAASAFTQQQADEKKQQIDDWTAKEIRRPFTERIRDMREEAELTRLVAQGRGSQAEFMRQAYAIQARMGPMTLEEAQQLADQLQTQIDINDALDRRNAQMEIHARLIGEARQAARDFLREFTEDPFGSIANLGKRLKAAFLDAKADELAIKLFGDPEKKFRDEMNRGIIEAGDALKGSSSALDDSAANLTEAAQALLATTGTPEAFTGVGGPEDGIFHPNSEEETQAIDAAFAKSAEQLAAAGHTAADALEGSADIVVQGGKKKEQDFGSVRERMNKMGEQYGAKIFGPNSPFTKAMGKLGTVMEGIAYGEAGGKMAGGLTGMRQSKMGSQMGGAAGALAAQSFGLPPELGGFIGGAIGGTVGGLFKKPKTGTATITDLSGNYSMGGNSTKAKAAAGMMADSVVGGLNRIAETLNGSVGAFAVSVGSKDGKIRVDPTGQGKTKTKKGAIDFGEDQEGAIRYAILDALKDGAINGIREGARRLLAAGKDLDTALDKALKFETVFRRLKAFKDPVGAAIDDVNREFNGLIAIFKEAGASAQEWAELEELYGFERAEAIKNATTATLSALDDWITRMTASPDSPLGRRTVYQNAKENLDKFRGDIAGKKPVDTDALLKAIENMQAASQTLYGSRQAFYTDFDDLMALAKSARDNTAATTPGTGGGGVLPPSPFEAMAPTFANTLAENQKQTGVLYEIRDALGRVIGHLPGGSGGSAAGSALGILPSSLPKGGGGGTGAGEAGGGRRYGVAADWEDFR